jgi:hypothetical protein
MFPRSLSDRIDTLVDELIEDGGLDSAALASILLTAHDSVERGYSMELSRRVWVAATELRCEDRGAIAPGAGAGAGVSEAE